MDYHYDCQSCHAQTHQEQHLQERCEQSQVTFTILPNAAQSKGSDYCNAIRVERNITVERAMNIAAEDANIDYFVYTKGWTMVLEIPPDVVFDPGKDPLNLVSRGNYIFDSGRPGYGYMRVFHHGDVVFFKNEGKALGTAPGLADTYLKNKAE